MEEESSDSSDMTDDLEEEDEPKVQIIQTSTTEVESGDDTTDLDPNAKVQNAIEGLQNLQAEEEEQTISEPELEIVQTTIEVNEEEPGPTLVSLPTNARYTNEQNWNAPHPPSVWKREKT